MPLHLNDIDVVSDVAGLGSALIIPCYMCPAVTVSVNENKPFLQLFSHFMQSPPFKQYLRDLQATLTRCGVETGVFKSHLLHQWFMCIWTSGRRRKLKRELQKYDAAIVLGCDSATETVRELVDGNNCLVIQGMAIEGFLNAKMTLHWPGDVSFEDARIVPITPQKPG